MYQNKLNFFKKNGYCILNLFSKNEYDHLLSKVIKKINNQINSKSKKFKKENIQNYHKLDLKKYHSKIVNSSNRYINLDKKLLKPIFNNKSLKEVSKFYWGHTRYTVKWVGSLKEPMKKNTTGFRIARPNKISKKDVGGSHIP